MPNQPAITVDHEAIERIKRMMEPDEHRVRLFAQSTPEGVGYGIDAGGLVFPSRTDTVVNKAGVEILIDERSLEYVQGKHLMVRGSKFDLIPATSQALEVEYLVPVEEATRSGPGQPWVFTNPGWYLVPFGRMPKNVGLVIRFTTKEFMRGFTLDFRIRILNAGNRALVEAKHIVDVSLDRVTEALLPLPLTDIKDPAPGVYHIEVMIEERLISTLNFEVGKL